MSNRKSMRLVAAAMALALFAAACGDDSGDGSTPPDDAPDAGESTSSSTTAPPDDGSSAPDTTIPLADAGPGVTAEAITIGFTAVDFDALIENLGVDTGIAGSEPAVEAIAAWYNENGGVLGRTLEVVFEAFLPVGPVEAEEVCVRLTEDVEAFAVLGGFVGPGAEEVNPCIPVLHETVLVGATPSAEQLATAGGLWVTPGMSLDRRLPAFAELLADSGELEDLGPIMLVGASGGDADTLEAVAGAFRDAGAEVPVVVTFTTTGDQFAAEADAGVFIERARSEGVSTVFMIGDSRFGQIAFFESAPELTYLLPIEENLAEWLSEHPEGLSPDTRVLTSTVGSNETDPDIEACRTVVEDAIGVEILPPDGLAEGELNYWAGMEGACRTFAVFTQIAEAAGPDLTNETWIAALSEMTDISVPGLESVSIGPDKYDLNDGLELVEYDYASLEFVPA